MKLDSVAIALERNKCSRISGGRERAGIENEERKRAAFACNRKGTQQSLSFFFIYFFFFLFLIVFDDSPPLDGSTVAVN